MGCACCGEPLAACWSTGRSRRHAYYLCDTRGCAESRKSFRKEKLEGAFDTLLTELVPTKGVFNVAFVMLRDLWNEKLASSTGAPRVSFGETYRTAFDFLANPWKRWRSECLEDRRAVLRLVFSDRLAYARNEGYRPAKSSIPFKMIGDFNMRRREMVEPGGIEPPTS